MIRRVMSKIVYHLKHLPLWAILTLALSFSAINSAQAFLEEGETIWSRTSNPGEGYDIAYGIAVDGSGIYVVGYDSSPGNTEWRIEKRSLTDGSLTWNRTSNPSIYSEEAYGVAADNSGIYVVGADSFPGNYEWRIEKRSLTDGTIIWSRTSNPSIAVDIALGIAVDGSGIYVVGYDSSPGNWEWRIEKRSLTDGSLLWSQTSDPSAHDDAATGVAVDDSAIYVVGTDRSPGDSGWRIEKRRLMDGGLLWSITSNPSTADDNAIGVAVDGSGIYVVGYDNSPGNYEWRIEKRNLTDGSLIWSQTSDPSAHDDRARGVAVDGSGIYVVGYDSSLGNTEWRIEKRSLTDGSLTWSRTSNPSARDDWARGVAVDGSGIYVVGHDKIPDNVEWRIEKVFKSNKILVVTDFSEIPVEILKPLGDQWTYEGYVYEFVDINQSIYYPGRDDAEKLRNYTRTKYDSDPFTHLFLIDIVYPNSTHIIPARVFWPLHNYKWWNDYYYANLYGNFDVDQNGTYGESLSDMNNVTDYQVIVGRLVLESPNHTQQLQNYVNSNIIYRTEKLSMRSSFIIYHREDYPMGGWAHPVILNLTKLTNSFGYQQFPHVYNYTVSEVAQALNVSNFALFYGHGFTGGQQIGWIEGEPDYYGPYINTNDFKAMSEISEPATILFGGCYTGEVYDTSNPDMAQITVATAPMIYLRMPAVMVVANTGIGGREGRVDYRILKSATKVTLAKAVLDEHVEEFSKTYWWPFSFSYGYFGDPTLKVRYLNLKDFDDIFANNNVRMVYPSDNPSKPLGCSAAWVSDWTASAFVATKLQNYTEGLDTDEDFVNQTSGKPIGSAGTGIVTFGGPIVNPVVKYAESDGTPWEYRAPIKWDDAGEGVYRFQYANGTNVPGTELSTSEFDSTDLFVIEVYGDGEGRYMMVCYGFGWKGTYAAGKYFHTTIYPDRGSYDISWVIVRWDDTNGDGFVNNPDDGDTYRVIASGT